MKINFNAVKEYCIIRYGKAWIKEDAIARKKPGYTGYKKYGEDGIKGKNKLFKMAMRSNIKRELRKRRIDQMKGKANDVKYLDSKGII
jgi:hypothetical protein